jgi:O-succinylbenzoic acid--CoA ligase
MTHLPNWLHRSAELYPSKLALRWGGQDWTFAELDCLADQVARSLADSGVRTGQRVALLAANSPSYAAVVHALPRLGAILVPLNTRLTRAELAWQLADVRATHLISDDRFAALAADLGQDVPDMAVAPPLPPPQASPGEANLDARAASCIPSSPSLDGDGGVRLIDLDAVHAIIYTSGTTGTPKGAQITYGMQWWNATASALNLGHDPADRWLAALPFFHVGGLTILMRSVIAGIGVVAHERFDPAAINRSIQADGVTIISVVAVMLQRMLEDQGDTAYPPALRCVLLGGGPAPQPLLAACAARNVPVVQTYGMTESCSQAVTLAPADALRKLGSAGKPLLPVRLRLATEGHAAAPNEAGEIYLRGPTITPGYVDRPEATARAFHDGWFATGDIGKLDDEGYLYVLDRRADLIISGGENIYPAEIEAALLGHPAVAEIGVIGVPDAQWGQVAVALAHLRPGATVTPEELVAFAAARLARYKVPRAVYLTGPLPRTASGKILRRELAALLPEE